MAPSTVIVLGYPREYSRPIWICRDPLIPLDQAWPKLKSLD